MRNWAQTWLCRDRDDGRGWLSGTDRPQGRHGVSWCGSGADLALGAATAVDAMPTLRRVRDFQVSGRVASLSGGCRRGCAVECRPKDLVTPFSPRVHSGPRLFHVERAPPISWPVSKACSSPCVMIGAQNDIGAQCAPWRGGRSSEGATVSAMT